MSFGDVLDAAKPREASATICVAGDLAGEHERLRAELQTEQAKAAVSIEGNPRKVELAQQLADLEARMSEATFTFTFRALPAQQWSNLLADHGPRSADETFNAATLPLALVKRCLVDPVASEADVDALAERLSDGAFEALFDAAWRCNRQGPSVPFSSAASAILSSID